MAIANEVLIRSLRETARRLAAGARYAWGHHGFCNCGNLLQTVTDWTGTEIIRYAHTRPGEWTELASDFCGTTGLEADQLVSELMKIGLNSTDIHHIEYLDDKSVLSQLPGGFRWLKRNHRPDVILYLNTYADLLEEQWKRREKEQYERGFSIPQSDNYTVQDFPVPTPFLHVT